MMSCDREQYLTFVPNQMFLVKLIFSFNTVSLFHCLIVLCSVSKPNSIVAKVIDCVIRTVEDVSQDP